MSSAVSKKEEDVVERSFDDEEKKEMNIYDIYLFGVGVGIAVAQSRIQTEILKW